MAGEPRPKSARCRICGCTELQPCRNAEGETCSWVGADKTLCTNIDCIAQIPLGELLTMKVRTDFVLWPPELPR